MKLSPEDLWQILKMAHYDGEQGGLARGRIEKQETVAAFLKENSALKKSLDNVENKAAAKAQRDCFPAVRAERLRIVKALKAQFADSDYKELLLQLGLDPL